MFFIKTSTSQFYIGVTIILLGFYLLLSNFDIKSKACNRPIDKEKEFALQAKYANFSTALNENITKEEFEAICQLHIENLYFKNICAALFFFVTGILTLILSLVKHAEYAILDDFTDFKLIDCRKRNNPLVSKLKTKKKKIRFFLLCVKIYLLTSSIFLIAQMVFIKLYKLESTKTIELLLDEKSNAALESNQQKLFDKILSNHYSLCEYRLNSLNQLIFIIYFIIYFIQLAFTMIGILMECSSRSESLRSLVIQNLLPTINNHTLRLITNDILLYRTLETYVLFGFFRNSD